MPSMTFRFTTECEMTLRGASYEEIYLRFKDFQHGDLDVPRQAKLQVCPPESEQMFFQLDEQDDIHEIDFFKGNFVADIVDHCDGAALKVSPVQISQISLSDAVRNSIPDVYW